MAKAHNSDAAPDEQLAATPAPAAKPKPRCGIVMPLSDTDGYPPGHWAQVQKLIIRAGEKAGFTTAMVSENLAEDMIHASIVRNIYHNEVVVCDVSSLNPNVMMELGMRMSTLLPLVLVFDGEIKYPFDINSILHVRYPKGLNIFRMEDFVEELASKIRKVHEAQGKKEYQPFLSHFKEVTIEPAKLESSSQDFSTALQTLLGEVSSMRSELKSVQKNSKTVDVSVSGDEDYNELSVAEKAVVREVVSRYMMPVNANEEIINSIYSEALYTVRRELYDGKLIRKSKYNQLSNYVLDRVVKASEALNSSF
jgi:hypothetical protein